MIGTECFYVYIKVLWKCTYRFLLPAEDLHQDIIILEEIQRFSSKTFDFLKINKKLTIHHYILYRFLARWRSNGQQRHALFFILWLTSECSCKDVHLTEHAGSACTCRVSSIRVRMYWTVCSLEMWAIRFRKVFAHWKTQNRNANAAWQ